MRWGYSQSSPRKRCRPRRCTAAVSSASPALTPRHSDAVTADAYRSPLKIKCIDLTELSRSDSLKVKRADGCRGAIAGEHQRVPRTVGCPRPRVQVTWAGERAAHGLTQSKSGEKKSNSAEKITTKKKILRQSLSPPKGSVWVRGAQHRGMLSLRRFARPGSDASCLLV